MDGFKYSLVSEEELVDFFNSNFLMNITYDAFTKPTRELVSSIYDKFLFDFGIEYRVPQLKAVQTDNIAMHAAGFPLINLMAALSELLSKTGLRDFCFSDIFKPQRRRNQIIFSQLVGLWTRFFEAQEAWKTVASKYEMMARKKNEVRKRLEEKKKKYEHALLENSRLKQEIPDPDKELAIAAEEFAQEKARSATLKSKQEKIKREIIHLKEQRAETIQQIAQKKEELAEKESQLVKSPEKVFTETSRKEKLRDEVRAERQLLSKQLLERQAELNYLKEELADDKTIIKPLEEFKQNLETLKATCLNILKHEESNKDKEMKISQLDIQIAKTKEITDGVIKQKLQAKKSHEQRMSTLKAMITEMEQKIGNLRKEKSANEESTSTMTNTLVQQLHKLQFEFDEERKTFESLDLEEKMSFMNLMEKFTPRINKILSDCKQTM